MLKKIVAGGLLGWVVMIAWIFLSNGILGIRSDIDMNRLLNEEWVYEILKESIREPGGYSVNPPLETPSGQFPENEPVFTIHYSGLGHEAAGRLFLVNIALAFAAQMLAAWLLSVTAERILARYSRRVLFFIGIGLLFALLGDMMRYGIGAYSLHHSLILAAQNLAGWTLAGLAVAWCVKPETDEQLSA
jgi:hypothetical protein